jgi:hypothetical protein
MLLFTTVLAMAEAYSLMPMMVLCHSNLVISGTTTHAGSWFESVRVFVRVAIIVTRDA